MEIRSNTYVISADVSGRQLNLFLLRGDYLFLIDTGVAGMPKELILPYLDDRGLAFEELTLFANTHAHADHMGGNMEIKAACRSAELAAHELDRPWIEDHELLCRTLYGRYPDMNLFGPERRRAVLEACGQDSPVDVAWRGGEMLDLGSHRLQVLHAPGHTPGNIAIYDRDRAILFEGETILGQATGEPGRLEVPYYYDVAAYRCTLRHLADLPWKLLLSSHADPRDRETGLQAIRHSLDFVDQFSERLQTVLASRIEPVTFASTVEAMSAKYGYSLDLGLALLVETHLEHEAKAGRVRRLSHARWASV